MVTRAAQEIIEPPGQKADLGHPAVMEPFVEIAQDFVHPMLNRTARQILDAMGQPSDDGD